MRRAVMMGAIPGFVAAVVGLLSILATDSGYAQSCGCGGPSCASGCCDTCNENNGDNCGRCCPYPLFAPVICLARLLGAGCEPCGCHGCSGEVWIGEWRNRCCDPCDHCGNFIGGAGPGPVGPVPVGDGNGGGCNCGASYSQRGAPQAVNTYVNARPSAPGYYSGPRPQSNYGSSAMAGYAARPTHANGEIVGQPRVISVTDDAAPQARNVETNAQYQRSQTR